MASITIKGLSKTFASGDDALAVAASTGRTLRDVMAAAEFAGRAEV